MKYSWVVGLGNIHTTYCKKGPAPRRQMSNMLHDCICLLVLLLFAAKLLPALVCVAPSTIESPGQPPHLGSTTQAKGILLCNLAMQQTTQ